MLGTYNPQAHKREEELKLKIDRIDHWLGVGAQPTDTAKSLIRQGRMSPEEWLKRANKLAEAKLKRKSKGDTAPSMEENTGEAEVRDTFKISRIGTIAGCMVTSGKILRNASVRVVRGDEQIFEGKLLSLKRFKDDVKEVAKGYDCGIQINDFNDLEVGDLIKCYQEIAVKKKL